MRLVILTFCLLSAFQLAAQDIILSNGQISRTIRYENNAFSSAVLSMSESDRNYISGSREFSFLLNGTAVDGWSGWELREKHKIEDEHAGQGISLQLQGLDSLEHLSLEVNYLIYPDLPLVRKWLRFKNSGEQDICIEGVNVEDLQTSFSHIHTLVYHNYARMKHLGKFVGDWHDPVIVLHHQTERLGMAVGNEAPGILKRTAYHTVNNNLEAGLTFPGQDYPFRKWLGPGETWETPKTFICLYRESDDGFAVVDGAVNDFVRIYMVPQIFRNDQKPVLVYNTWNPFRTFVNDTLVREVARAAAECGIEEFIIDDGWQVNRGSGSSEEAWGKNYGDWLVDEEKFPGGLGPTFDYIRSLGMKPGIWMSIGAATGDAKVYAEHPEWFIRDPNGDHGNIHGYGDDFYTSCFGTDWPGYIKERIVDMWKEYGLVYAKLDFAIAASAYVNDPDISGCYAGDHPYHRDHQESFIAIYERVLELFDLLHRDCPGLFIDCTFETAGKLQLMDYAIANHADGNWLSNFEEPSPTGPLRIRQMAWWRSPAIPASSLVIGNTPLDDPGFEFALKSLIGTLPIVLGDPRALPPEDRARIRLWSEWMQKMQEDYDYMSYRRDLPGFGEPREGAWDGWMRINKETHTGGILGIFRQGAPESCRQVVVKDLDPERDYLVLEAPEGKVIHRASGMELMNSGFQICISDPYNGMIFEISPDDQ